MDQVTMSDRCPSAFDRVLQFWQMSNTITIRLPDHLIEWLADVSRKTGMPVSRIVRQQLESAREQDHDKPYMKLAGKLKGLPRDLSTREGFGRR
jgi:Ribbon-helix-helix domain